MELDQLNFERDLALSSMQPMVDSADDEAEFRVRTKELNMVKKQFFVNQAKIEKALAKDNKFNAEEQKKIREQFDSLYFRVQVLLDNIKLQRRQSIPNTSTADQSRAVISTGFARLPKLQLPTFSGILTEWYAFYDLYRSLVHDNQQLTDVERFRYLLLSLRGEPFNLIKSIPVTDVNYESALQVLVHRYENKRIITTKHLDKILDAEPVTERNIQAGLRNILNIYHENLTALDAFGHPTKEWSFILLNLLLRKIPGGIRKRFELSLASATDTPLFTELLDFLDRELSAFEVMTSSSTQMRGPVSAGGGARSPCAGRAVAPRSQPAQLQHILSSSRSEARPPPQAGSYSRVMNAHASTTTAPKRRVQDLTCPFCKDISHALYRCDKFTNLTLPERKTFIKENKICINCLCQGHEVQNCFSTFTCRVCGKRHHTSTHEDLQSSNVNSLTYQCSNVNLTSSETISDYENKITLQNPENLQMKIENSTVLLTTALVNLRPLNLAPFAPCLVRALVDQGSQVTLISESCVQRLGLPRYHVNRGTTVSGIGDKYEKARGYVLCEITPHHQPEPKLYIEALILPKITNYIPWVPTTFNKLPHLQNLTLADPELGSARPIELLLGSNYTDNILLHKIIKGPQGTPVAIHSIFGYLLNGKFSHSVPRKAYVNTNILQLNLQLQNFCEFESGPDCKTFTRENALCEAIFVNTYKQDNDGKYVVALPFKEGAPPLKCTKRIILPEISKIYNPLGFLSHITLFSKNLTQFPWAAGTQWADEPQKGVCDLWLQFIGELPPLRTVTLSRQVIPYDYEIIRLHGFSGASEKGYSACVYIRVINETKQINTFLIIYKTKVAPLKRITLPRLELCGALLLSKLLQKVIEASSSYIKIDEVYAWSDLSIVLSWIRSKGSSEWRTFVSNRITEITSRVPSAHWHHVTTTENPADPASRGVLPSQLNRELWFYGPPWLHLPSSEWPTSKIDFHTDEERRKTLLCTLQKDSSRLYFIERLSSLSKLLRVSYYIFRFTKKGQQKLLSHTTKREREEALLKIIKVLQNEAFCDDLAQIIAGEMCSNRLQKLKPVIDEDGTFKIGGRIERSPQLFYETRQPILLPTKHNFTNLINNYFYKLYLHVGPQTLHYLITRKYWIISARNAIYMPTRKCVRWFRSRSMVPQPVMAPLPEAKVSALRPYLKVATDFTGPFNLKASAVRSSKALKIYGCVFVCKYTRATYLEWVPNLSTKLFLNAPHRLVSRRGMCSDIYSDCGRNLVGADRYIRELLRFLREESAQNTINTKLPPLKWRLAFIHKLHPGSDGVIRVVTVLIGNTFFTRPVVKVCPLPI